MFLKPLRQRLAHSAFNGGADFRRDQLVLGLGGEFRVRYFHRQHAGQAFAGIIAGDRDLGLRGQARRGRIGVDDAGQRAAETGQVGTAIALRDVVGEAEDILVIAVIPLQRRFHRHAILLAGDQDRRGEDRGLVAIQVGHKGSYTAIIDHGVRIELGLTLIAQGDLDAGVQEGELAQAVLQRFAIELGHGEGFFRRHKAHFRALLARLGIAHHLEVFLGIAAAETHPVPLAIAPDGQVHPVGQGVHHRDADAVQTAGDLVGILVELTAGMELGHDDLGRRDTFFLVDVSRDAPTIITHRGRTVGMERHQDFRTMAGKGFVDRVVDDLIDHVMETRTVIGITDIHARALAHGVEPFEDLDRLRAVFLIRLFRHGFVVQVSHACDHSRAHAYMRAHA